LIFNKETVLVDEDQLFYQKWAQYRKEKWKKKQEKRVASYFKSKQAKRRKMENVVEYFNL
jgi:hypothetical protein